MMRCQKLFGWFAEDPSDSVEERHVQWFVIDSVTVQENGREEESLFLSTELLNSVVVKMCEQWEWRRSFFVDPVTVQIVGLSNLSFYFHEGIFVPCGRFWRAHILVVFHSSRTPAIDLRAIIVWDMASQNTDHGAETASMFCWKCWGAWLWRGVIFFHGTIDKCCCEDVRAVGMT